MNRLLLLGGLFGALLLPATPGITGDDIYSVAANTVHSPRYTVSLYGFNNSVASTEESVWDGDDATGAAAGPVRCFANMNTGATPTAAAIFMSSDDEADAGEIITVDALDANWDPVTIAVTLGTNNTSGTTNVQIGSANLMRINRAYAGNTAIVGNVFLHLDDTIGTDGEPDTPATDVVAMITIGANETNMACYSVPNNYDAFLTNVCVSNESTTGSALARFRIRSSENGEPARVKEFFQVPDLENRCTEYFPPIANRAVRIRDA